MTARALAPPNRWTRGARREAKTKPASSGAYGGSPAGSRSQRTAEGGGTSHLDVYELSRRLCVPVTIDESGWLRDEIELLFVRKPDGIHPTELKIGSDVSAAKVRRLSNVFALCERYNRAVHRLQLMGSAELMRQIASREEEHMGYRRVRYFTLVEEIPFFEQLVTEVTE